MSVNDEDTELRDLLLQTLEKNGVLGKIKAELRAGVFLALESQEQSENISNSNKRLLNFRSQNASGQTCLELVQEFLTYFDLDYTNAVFSVEANSNTNAESRSQLLKKLNIQETERGSTPVLGHVLNSRPSEKNSPDSSPSKSQIEIAKQIFQEHLNNLGPGLVSKTKATDILSQLCPEFPRYLLQSFVDDEVRHSTPQSISCSTFMQIYEKLFKLCSTVITGPHALGDSTKSSYKDTAANLSGEYDRMLVQSDKDIERNLDDLLNQEHVGSVDYEGDFNSASQTSISEDLQGDGLSSAPSSFAELTEDHTLEENNHDMDYTEDI